MRGIVLRTHPSLRLTSAPSLQVDMARIKATYHELNARSEVVLENISTSARRAANRATQVATRGRGGARGGGRGGHGSAAGSGEKAFDGDVRGQSAGRGGSNAAGRGGGEVVRAVGDSSGGPLDVSSWGHTSATSTYMSSIGSSAFLPSIQDSEDSGGIKLQRRYRPGGRELRDIQQFQKGGALLLPKIAFMRVVRETAHLIKSNLRFKADGVEALQEASEAFLVALFEDCVLCAVHAKRKTIQRSDLLLALRI